MLAVAGDLRPVGGRDYPRTYQEFRSWFPDEWRCREYLAGLRWPEGFVCPAAAAVATGGRAKACGCARRVGGRRR